MNNVFWNRKGFSRLKIMIFFYHFCDTLLAVRYCLASKKSRRLWIRSSYGFRSNLFPWPTSMYACSPGIRL